MVLSPDLKVKGLPVVTRSWISVLSTRYHHHHLLWPKAGQTVLLLSHPGFSSSGCSLPVTGERVGAGPRGEQQRAGPPSLPHAHPRPSSTHLECSTGPGLAPRRTAPPGCQAIFVILLGVSRDLRVTGAVGRAFSQVATIQKFSFRPLPLPC